MSDVRMAMMGEAAWPLSNEREELLVMLGSMIGRFGAERFVEAPVVSASKRDFPDRWEPSLHAVHQLLYRLCWLAHVDPEIAVVDVRPIRDNLNGMLHTTECEIASCNAGVVTFHLASIGNDDVAGVMSHKIGQAFLDLAPGEPFRTPGRHETDEVEGTVAAVYLGLGVLAANSSMYRRHAARVVGREERSEQLIAQAGGLDIADATLLLAVQDLVRDDVPDAYATLHAAQRDWLERWRDVLEPHEAELRELLRLDEERAPLQLKRAAEPRRAPAVSEAELKRFNRGREIRRVRNRSVLGVIPGLFLGILCGAVVGRLALGPGTGALVVGLGVMVLGGVFGWWRWCRPFYTCADGACRKLISAKAATCAHCGGTITATITLAELQAHWAVLRAAEDERDALLDESEFAGDPDLEVPRSIAKHTSSHAL